MKAIIISALVSLAVVEVFGGSLYGEKDDVISEVTMKFSEVQTYLTAVVTHINSEREKSDNTAKEDALSEGTRRKTITEEEFQREIVASTRTAIAKGKPAAAIDCIANVAKEGKKNILEVNEIHNKAVEAVLPNMTQKLNFLTYETEIIKAALEGLLQEFNDKIKDAKSGFQTFKTDGLKKAESAKKQIDEIETRIGKPSLLTEYLTTKRKMTEKFKELKQSLTKKLQQCVA